VCGLDVPVPYSNPLERYWLPSVADVVATVQTVAEAK
jgi:pyruvate/2-oxoglutarate/acetoin dehydrogenase E1 component